MSDPRHHTDEGLRAFPNDGSWANGAHEGGMSLRDWFAGQALSAIAQTDPSGNWDKECARRAYQYADAMLAERVK